MNPQQKSYLENIKNVLTEQEISDPSVADKYRAIYTGSLIGLPEYQAICGPGSTPDGGVITTTTNTNQDCKDERTSKNELCCNEGRRPNADKTNCEPDPDNSLTVTDSGTPGGTSGGTAGGDTTGGNTDDNQEIVVTGTRPPCGENMARNEESKKCECKEGFSLSEDGKSCKASEVDPQKTCTDEKTELVGNECLPKCDADKEQRNADTKKCEPKAPADATVSLDVSSKVKDANFATVTAKLNPDSVDRKKYIVIWFSKGSTRATNENFGGAATPKPVKSAEDIVGSIPDQPESSGDDATATPPVEENKDWDRAEDLETKIERDDSMELDAPRLSNDYEMCARLVEAGSHAKIDEKCAKVPRKAAPRATGGMPGMQPMGPTRGGASDAIFRGVR
jgi:hypothetical protein